MIRKLFICCLAALFGLSTGADIERLNSAASAQHRTDRSLTEYVEVLLSESENAYNPMPNQDGGLIAYVRTGWEREGGSGGFGRSNRRSDVMVMNVDGTLLTKEPLADAFLSGWTSDGQNLICYRDGRYFLISVGGEIIAQGQIPNKNRQDMRPERVSYLSSIGSPVWIQNDSPGGVIQTPRSKVAQSTGGLVATIIRSTDDRYGD